MYKQFAIAGKRPIYDPEEFQELCADAGAPTIFPTILAVMTDGPIASTQKSEYRRTKNGL